MLSFQKKTLIAAGIAANLLSFSAFVAADTQQDLIDTRQETQIWTTYALSPYLRANDIKVTVHSGKATLTGFVEESVNKDLAKQIALGVSGVKDVDNQIVVQADYKPKNLSHDYGQAIDDATVTTAVISRLAWSKNIDSQAINVQTQAGRVTLTGMVYDKEAKETAGKLALSTRGVYSVSNQLMTGNKPVVQDSSKPMSDTWITTKVKSTFFYSSNVSGSAIEVTTKDGVVSLKGHVESGAERALATELAQNIRGVKSVNAKDLTI